MRYIWILAIVAGLVACNSSKSSIGSSFSGSTLNGEWKMKGNFMFDSLLVFNRIDKAVEPEEFEEVFIINNGDLSYEIRTEIGICGNGLFFLDSASVLLDRKNVAVFLDGGYREESELVYDAEFKLKELTKNQFTIELKKVNTEEVKSLYGPN